MLRTVGLIVGNALGKVLGVVREVALAYFFGAGAVADAYRVSMSAALIPTNFFMGDVLDGAFVPLYTRYLNSNRASALHLFRLTRAYLLGASLVLVGAMVLAGRLLVRLFAPGLAVATVDLATRMTALMGLAIPFLSLGALLSLVGLCQGRVRALALRSVFQNAGLIVILPLAAWLARPELLGVGFAVGFVAYLGFVLWDLRGLWGGETLEGAEGHELRRLFATAFPLIWLMVLGQVLSIVDRASASFVGTGAVASLEYARVFTETPHVLLGTAVAATSLVTFATLSANDVPRRAAALVMPLITCAAVVMLVLAAVAPEVVVLFYQRGRFDAAASLRVTQALRGLAVGTPFLVGSYVLQRILSAQLRSRDVLVPMTACVGVAVAGNIILMPRLGLLGIGLAMSAAQLVLCLVLAARIGILREVAARAPGWLFAAGLAAASVVALRAISGGPAMRLLVVGAVSGAVVSGGLLVWPPTRADLGWARERVGVAGKGLLARARTALTLGAQ